MGGPGARWGAGPEPAGETVSPEAAEGVLPGGLRGGSKIPAGGSPEEFSCPARSRAPPPAPSRKGNERERVAC